MQYNDGVPRTTCIFSLNLGYQWNIAEITCTDTSLTKEGTLVSEETEQKHLFVKSGFHFEPSLADYVFDNYPTVGRIAYWTGLRQSGSDWVWADQSGVR